MWSSCFCIDLNQFNCLKFSLGHHVYMASLQWMAFHGRRQSRSSWQGLLSIKDKRRREVVVHWWLFCSSTYHFVCFQWSGVLPKAWEADEEERSTAIKAILWILKVCEIKHLKPFHFICFIVGYLRLFCQYNPMQ